MSGNSAGRPIDSRYLEQLSKLPNQLVFIMGCHRSGTSMLHHLLAYTGKCDYISAYDIVEYDELIANRVEGREEAVKAALDAEIRSEKTRGLDNLPVGADCPEEYRFLLAPPSPNWILDPAKHIGRQVFMPHLTPEKLDRFLEICRKKRFLTRDEKPLILKNPNDRYFNFREIHEMLPEAKMIFLHRHPLHILNSYVAGFGGILETRSRYIALLDEGYRTIFESPISRMLLQRLFESRELAYNLALALSQSFEYHLENIRRIPGDRYLSLSYEDLCKDPRPHLEEIGRFLNVELNPTIPEDFVAPRRLNVPAHLLAAYEQRAPDMRDYLESQNYSMYPEGWTDSASEQRLRAS